MLDSVRELETQALVVECRGRDPGLQGERKPVRTARKDWMGLKTQASLVLAHARVKAARVLQSEAADAGAPTGGEPELRARPERHDLAAKEGDAGAAMALRPGWDATQEQQGKDTRATHAVEVDMAGARRPARIIR